jgi:hypothetical protein
MIAPKKNLCRSTQISVSALNGAVHFSGPDAACAYVGLSDLSVFFDPNGLDIGIPFPSRMPVRVRYVVTGNLALAANLALL